MGNMQKMQRSNCNTSKFNVTYVLSTVSQSVTRTAEGPGALYRLVFDYMRSELDSGSLVEVFGLCTCSYNYWEAFFVIWQARIENNSCIISREVSNIEWCSHRIKLLMISLNLNIGIMQYDNSSSKKGARWQVTMKYVRSAWDWGAIIGTVR